MLSGVYGNWLIWDISIPKNQSDSTTEPGSRNGRPGIQSRGKANDKIEISGGWGAGMIIGSVGLTFTNFSMRNIFNWESYRPLPQGDGQTLSLKAQTNGKYYTSFSVSFREPWLGGKNRIH